MEVALQKPELVRKAQFAGESYSADPAELVTLIDKRIASTRRPAALKGDIAAIITPANAETLYGESELGALRGLNHKKFSTVIVVASAQQGFFGYASVFQGGAYDTPLGRLFVDLPLAERMANLHPRVVFSASGHTGGKDAEYCIEMVLPLLQKMLGDFRFVPIVMGSEDDEYVAAVGEVLAATAGSDKTLIVGCSELVIDSAVGARTLNPVIEAASQFEWRTLYDRLRNLNVPGTAPLAAITYAAQRLKIKQVEALSNAHNDQTTLSFALLR